MKKIILLAVFVWLGSALFAQTKAIEKFYEQYKGMEEVTDLKLRGWVLQLASKFSEEAEAAQLLRKITQLRILTMENGNLVSPQVYRQLVKDLQSDRFEDLFKVQEKGQNIQFLIREQGDTITDVLLLVSGDDHFVLLSLEGALRFSDLQNLQIDVEGSEHFKKLPRHKKDIPRA